MKNSPNCNVTSHQNKPQLDSGGRSETLHSRTSPEPLGLPSRAAPSGCPLRLPPPGTRVPDSPPRSPLPTSHARRVPLEAGPHPPPLALWSRPSRLHSTLHPGCGSRRQPLPILDGEERDRKCRPWLPLLRGRVPN